MPISFYALLTIMISSLLLTLLPFAGFPHAWDKALTSVFGALIFGVSAFSLYRAYVLIIARMERRERSRNKRENEKEVSEGEDAQ